MALAKFALQVEPAHHLLVHLGVEDRVAALAVGLGAVHRDVGVAHHLLRRGLRAVASAIPIDAPMNSSRPSSRNGACRLCRTRSAMIVASRGLADVVEQQRELVAAQAGDGVVGPQRRLEPLRDRLAAAGRRRAWPSESLMTLKRSRSRNSTAAQHSGCRRRARRIDWSRRSTNSTRFGQAGERVVERVVLQAALGLAAVGDVGDASRRRGSRGRARRAPRSRGRASSGSCRRGAGSGARTRSARSARSCGRSASSACVSGARSSACTRPSHSPRVVADLVLAVAEHRSSSAASRRRVSRVTSQSQMPSLAPLQRERVALLGLGQALQRAAGG